MSADDIALRDTQSGFAGPTGTSWHIAPTGYFVVTKIVNGVTTTASRSGYISQAERDGLIAALDGHDIGSLPELIGDPAIVNARTLELEYRGKTAVLNVSSGTGEALGAPLADATAPSRRMIAGANAVKALLGK